VKKEAIDPSCGPRPTMLYAAAIKWDKLLFVSGQTGSDFLTKEFPEGISEQAELAFARVKDLAEQGGSRIENALKLTIFMTDMHGEFDAMNAVFNRYFPNNPPARSTVGVAHLARKGLKIEVEMVAFIDD
jgi:2-iminobutanoate/2-iminopropanoate deaminase